MPEVPFLCIRKVVMLPASSVCAALNMGNVTRFSSLGELSLHSSVLNLDVAVVTSILARPLESRII